MFAVFAIKPRPKIHVSHAPPYRQISGCSSGWVALSGNDQRQDAQRTTRRHRDSDLARLFREPAPNFVIVREIEH